MHTQTTEAKTNVLDGYVTRQGFAKQIGKTVRTLDRWEALRIGPPRVQCGRLVLYRVEAVREWLNGREQRTQMRRRGVRR